MMRLKPESQSYTFMLKVSQLCSLFFAVEIRFGLLLLGLKLILHMSLQWVEVNPRRKLTLMRIASCLLIRFLLTTRLILPQVGSNIACPVSLQSES